ncbi:ATP-binding cassette domain-containing protein [Actinomadura graeca]|uniref:ATP-binding cassette domain-containing protein n=1 Tax=Actinomadura graeca TaxID=2750812 RepID=UPI001E641012|nr:ATP-binding cassette domain-containing protein [Actinomadura graeca]
MTFGVAEGVVGLAGPPGVGKSTLLATFATLRRPNAGALHILGHDITNNADLRAARALIGYLPGGLSRAENMTAGEFVAYAAYYKRAGASAARDMVRRLDLADAAGTELCLLPPDVRLRAGIAAACVHRPAIALLDDPSGWLQAAAGPWPGGGGDPGASITAMAELAPLLRSLAPTVVVTADAAATLTGWCDRLLTLTRGKLAELPARPAAVGRGRLPAGRRLPAHRADASAPWSPAAVQGPAVAPGLVGTSRPDSGPEPEGGPGEGPSRGRRRPARLVFPQMARLRGVREPARSGAGV